jgi:hypothetical protein
MRPDATRNVPRSRLLTFKQFKKKKGKKKGGKKHGDPRPQCAPPRTIGTIGETQSNGKKHK